MNNGDDIGDGGNDSDRGGSVAAASINEVLS